MLLTKTVKVKWNGANKKWYESKGYIWTKSGDEFEVDIRDLTKGATSRTKVEAKCDNPNCEHNIQQISYKNYLLGLKKTPWKVYLL